MAKKIGIILIILSFINWGIILVSPFISMNNTIKVSLAVSSEIFFWGGDVLAGKEIAQKYRRYFNPMNWCKINKRITTY